MAHSFEQALQWVHGPRTVVMTPTYNGNWKGSVSFNGSTEREPWLCRRAAPALEQLAGASMGPRSENRGHHRHRSEAPRDRLRASMGPRSENRTYVRSRDARLGASPFLRAV